MAATGTCKHRVRSSPLSDDSIAINDEMYFQHLHVVGGMAADAEGPAGLDLEKKRTKRLARHMARMATRSQRC
jgi:hypothetical protein